MTGWWKRRRQQQHDEHIAQRARELREFVYLDEVSVISLLSSRLGKLPSEFTETIADAKKAEVNATAEANAAVFKSRLGSRYEASWTENSQVLSKATIQATFKRLYEEEEDSLALRPVSSSDSPPDVEGMRQGLSTGDDEAELTPWIVGPAGLTRGRLAEVEVELQADPAFRLSTIVTTFKELVEESPLLLAQADQKGFDTAIELNRVLEKLMAGLVPLKCRVVDYEVATIGQRECLMHRHVLEQLPADQIPELKPLYLVGVTQGSLYWKDIRRILFSKARFRVLCRLNYAGLRTSWTPVKLVDVVGEIVPSLKDDMDMFGLGALQAIMEGSTAHAKFVEPRMRALTTFGARLAQHLGLELSDNDRQQIKVLASETADLLTSVPESRKAFSQIAELLAAQSASEIDPTVVANLRLKASRENGLTPGGSAVRADLIPVPKTIAPDDERFIDAEVVAIYW